MTSELEKAFQYYLNHRDELVKQYDGKVLVIKDDGVVGAYDTDVEARAAARKQFEMGTYLIQRCSLAEDDHQQHFHSRVCFDC